MSKEVNVIAANAAAEERGVSKQAVFQAMNDGRLTDYRTGNLRLVVKDEKYERWLRGDSSKQDIDEAN